MESFKKWNISLCRENQCNTVTEGGYGVEVQLLKAE